MKRELETAGLALWALLAPIHPALLMLICLPFVDLLLGIAASLKQKRVITSTGLGRTIGKIVLYSVALVLAFACETWLMGASVPCVKGICGFIGLRELKSCFEHLDEIYGGDVLKIAIDIVTQKKPPGDV